MWLRYARWLVAGLTFQLAADIIETAITPSWEELAKVGAIAVIRTFLNFFLERDLNEVRDAATRGGRTPIGEYDAKSDIAFDLFVAAAASLAGAGPAIAQTDPLPSWNDGAPKKAIIDFVARVTTEGSSGFRAGAGADRDLRQ